MVFNEILLTIILIVGWLTAIFFECQCIKWRNKHNEAVTSWIIESRNKDKQILKLQEEIKAMKEE